jgi:hypothetical protein
MNKQAPDEVEYRSAGLRGLIAPDRTLRLSPDGLEYSGPGQRVAAGWRDVQAIVPSNVRLPIDGGQATVACLGIVLRLPFSHPTLVDGYLPGLDYAVPIDDLAKWPPGTPVTPLEILDRASVFARAAGVAILSASPKVNIA